MTNPQGPPNEARRRGRVPAIKVRSAHLPLSALPSGYTPAMPAQPPQNAGGSAAEHPPRSRPHSRPDTRRRPTPPARPRPADCRPASEEPAPAKKKRRTSRPAIHRADLVIVVSLVVAGLIGGELYARHVADTKVAEAVACEVKDQATASFGVAPLLLWQLATQHFTNISVETAGNQIRDAKGMKIDLSIKDVKLGSRLPLQGHHRLAGCDHHLDQRWHQGVGAERDSGSGSVRHQQRDHPPRRRHHRAEGHVGRHHGQAGGVRQRDCSCRSSASTRSASRCRRRPCSRRWTTSPRT